eukprot:2589338-Amphidinium_carterae.1
MPSPKADKGGPGRFDNSSHFLRQASRSLRNAKSNHSMAKRSSSISLNRNGSASTLFLPQRGHAGQDLVLDSSCWLGIGSTHAACTESQQQS